MKIFYTDAFGRQLKKLPRHFRNISKELHAFFLEYSPNQKESIGKSCYKIRWSPENTSKGKSGSLRIIVFLVIKDDILVPVSIYAKSEKETISNKELHSLLLETLSEL